MVTISAGLTRILDEYREAVIQPFEAHPLASFVRHDIVQAVEAVVEDLDRYIVKGSVGQGNWTRGPWVAIFDSTVTDSAQRGFYVVFLVREDLAGVYLSLNQGVTDVQKQYKRETSEVLEIRARDLAARVDRYPRHFKPGPIDLAATGRLTRDYQVGSALSVYYSKASLPAEETIQADVRTMLELYRRIVLSGGMSPISKTDDDSDLPPEVLEIEEDLTAYREHKRVERDPKVARAVKKAKGYTCEVCSLNFEALYGEIGREYIEAHHLQPVHQVQGQKLRRNPLTDFAVLCSNCHRMIHRSGRPDDVAGLRERVQKSKTR